MSENRRISFRELRIHRGPAAEGAAEPALPAQRFARLMNGRPAEARVPPVARDLARHRETAAALAADAADDVEPGEATEDDALRAELSGRLAQAARAMRAWRETREIREPPTTAVAAIGPAQLQHDRELTQYLAQTVGRFCNDPAVAHGTGWQVRLVLDPEILPDTTLELALSPLWLSLRFASDHARARHLVSSHQDLLQQLLENTLVPRREIAIHLD